MRHDEHYVDALAMSAGTPVPFSYIAPSMSSVKVSLIWEIVRPSGVRP